MEDIYKEVYYGNYCKQCIHYEESEMDDPCHECLNDPMNLYSHRPLNFKEKENG